MQAGDLIETLLSVNKKCWNTRWRTVPARCLLETPEHANQTNSHEELNQTRSGPLHDTLKKHGVISDEINRASDIRKSYGCNTALKSLSSHAGTMQEPCGPMRAGTLMTPIQAMLE